MRTVRIEVTAEDIAWSLKNYAQECACQCPIAKAVQRATGDGNLGVFAFDRREASPTSFIISTTGAKRLASLPAAANDFVRRFDAMQEVEPFSFDLELPDSPPHTEGGESHADSENR